ncbi:hypothetical protein COOONC_24794 [Cooperia oncophora]
MVSVPHKAGSKLVLSNGATGEKSEDATPESATKASTSVPEEAAVSSSPKPGEATSEASGEVPTGEEKESEATTTSAGESSGEEPSESQNVPNVQANEDEEATIVTTSPAPPQTTEATSTTTEESRLTSSEAEGASEATSTTPSGAETSVTPSATSLPESLATEAGEGTTVEGGPSVEPTTAGPIEASGEEPAVSNKSTYRCSQRRPGGDHSYRRDQRTNFYNDIRAENSLLAPLQHHCQNRLQLLKEKERRLKEDSQWGQQRQDPLKLAERNQQ